MKLVGLLEQPSPSVVIHLGSDDIDKHPLFFHNSPNVLINSEDSIDFCIFLLDRLKESCIGALLRFEIIFNLLEHCSCNRSLLVSLSCCFDQPGHRSVEFVNQSVVLCKPISQRFKLDFVPSECCSNIVNFVFIPIDCVS